MDRVDAGQLRARRGVGGERRVRGVLERGDEEAPDAGELRRAEERRVLPGRGCAAGRAG